MNNYICKIASLDEVASMFDFYIENDLEERENWIKWKETALDNCKNGRTINYHGVLDGKIICECTAALDPKNIQNSEGLIDKDKAYLLAFRTLPEYRGKGYFTPLFNFMIEDFKKRGIRQVTLGVEPGELKNKSIYEHYGFTEHIKNAQEVYPDGTVIDVEYYGKTI